MKYHGIIISENIDDGQSKIIDTLRNTDEFNILNLYEIPNNVDSETNSSNTKIKKINLDSIDSEGIIGFPFSEFNKMQKKDKTTIICIPHKYLDNFIKKADEKEYCFMSFLIKPHESDLSKEKHKDFDNLEKSIFGKISYVIDNNNSDTVAKLICKLWEFKNTGGMLPRNIINWMINCGMLFKDTEESCISNASYDMQLGDEYYYSGQIKKLTNKDPFIMIEPYDYVIASCKEKCNFPRDISARFDVSVDLFCEGVILSNSTQVDPGFRGKLFCLLFNTSNKTVYLKRNQHFLTIEFHKLLEPTTPYSGRFAEKGEIFYYLPTNVMQGAINELKKEIEELKRESKNMQSMYIGVLALILAVIAMLIVF